MNSCHNQKHIYLEINVTNIIVTKMSEDIAIENFSKVFYYRHQYIE